MGISIWQLAIILLLVLLLFGAGKVKHLSEDLGAAIKGFRKGLAENENSAEAKMPPKPEQSSQIQRQSEP